ncbi:pyridoxamine 5'-phosphate oxidase family protein [Polycladidibacter stylochi]|uniref:pyridoxamine 5'-phosphate oxidase family protein n=1 Tax=Polycladidibacter stylochi TaxID=1807766 RepID=UPI000831CE14|nr:pyridoxamine 5'-phosphate oxidase family protein [Pseudovibrio stylochi]
MTVSIDTKQLPKYARVRTTKRAQYDTGKVYAIIDQSLVAHVSFIHEDRPMVIPMAFARQEDTLYIHGAKAARIIKENAQSAQISMAFTHIDGIVAAKSAMHHSVNYRSVVIHGTAEKVTDQQEHQQALIAITEHLLPGRYAEVRPDTAKELNATGVLAITIDSAAAKVRSGPPVDDPEDEHLQKWSGVIPITTALGPAQSAKHDETIELPASIRAAQKKFA